MKKLLLLGLLLPALLSCSVAQRTTQTKYASLLNEEAARTHLTTLTSKEFAGRGTGQEGGEKTARYIAEVFEELGLSPAVQGSFFQPVALERSVYKVNRFHLGGQSLTNGKDFFVQGDNANQSFQADEIVVAGYGIQSDSYNDLAGVDVTGKVVLIINEGEPTDQNGQSLITGSATPSDWTTSRFKKIQELSQLNPKLILAVSSETATMIERMGARLTGGRFSLRTSSSSQEQVGMPVPVANLTPDQADQLLQVQQTSVEKLKAEINDSKTPRTFTLKASLEAEMGVVKEAFNDPNVLGVIEGSDLKEEVVIISGHYDHDGILPDGTYFPGADDNGSGTVGVLELARAFAQAKKDGNGPRRTILFLAFAAEEKGLLGSNYYSQNPIFPLENTVTCLNMDMIGRIDDKHLEGNHNYIHAIGSEMLSSELKAINEKANQTYTQMELDYMYDDPNDPMRIYYRSDQYNLAKHGIPVIFYFSGLHPDYHTPNDTVDKIDFEMMVKREKLVFHTAWEIANRDQRLIVDKTPESPEQ